MAKSHGRGSSTPTLRHLNHRNRVEHVVAQMRAGAQLLLHYNNGKPTWLLNPGGAVAPETALDVIDHVDVCSVGDCLFADCPAQTFRYIES
jgi:hypothetical protein